MNAHQNAGNPSAPASPKSSLPEGATAPTAARAMWIISQREITTRLRSKAFIVSMSILIFVILAGVVGGGIASQIIGDEPASTSVAMVPDDSATVDAAPLDAAALEAGGFAVTEVADRTAAEQLVQDEEVDAAVVPGGGSGVGLTVIALSEPPADLVQALSSAPTVELLSTPDDDGGFNVLGYLVAMGFGMVFYVSALTFGTTIAQSVVEEKQTRIVEILLATVPARILLAGKLLGNSILAIGTVVVTLVLVAIAMFATGQEILLGDLGSSLVWFPVLFAFGFVLLATMYAGAASLVSRQEDIGSVTSPVMMLVMIPFFLVIFFFDNERVLAIMSYIPFSAPVGMPVRLFMGGADWWEPFVSLAIVLATILLLVGISSRIYSNSILRTGARVSLKDAVKK